MREALASFTSAVSWYSQFGDQSNNVDQVRNCNHRLCPYQQHEYNNKFFLSKKFSTFKRLYSPQGMPPQQFRSSYWPPSQMFQRTDPSQRAPIVVCTVYDVETIWQRSTQQLWPQQCESLVYLVSIIRVMILIQLPSSRWGRGLWWAPSDDDDSANNKHKMEEEGK